MDWRSVARNGVPMLVAGIAFAVFAAWGTRLPVSYEQAWQVFAGVAAVAAFASGLCPRRVTLRGVAGVIAAAFILGYGYEAWHAGGVGSYSVWVQIGWATAIAWSWGRHG